MDDLMGALGESIANAGPQWALVLAAIAIFATQMWPGISDLLKRASEREDRREERKAEESRQRELHDRESAAMQGRWLEQQDRSNAAMEASNEVSEGLRVQLAALNDNLVDSKERSRRMGDTVGDMAAQVREIHNHVVKGEKKDG